MANDREDIKDLYTRYSILIDTGKYDQWLDCFTDDGTFESPRFGRHEGREGLRKFTALYKESLGGAQPRHITSNVCAEINGDTATGICYLTYYHCKFNRAELSALGYYTDTLRKVNGQWRFASRKVSIDGHA